MARTIRNISHRVNTKWMREPYPNRDHARDIRKANRIDKGADGTSYGYIMGSAIEGRLNTWHDVPKAFGKRYANKQIRRYYNKEIGCFMI